MFKRLTALYLALFGMFFQILVAGFHIPPALALAGLQLSSPVGDPASLAGPYRTLVICTIRGVQTITLDENNEPLQDGSPVRSGDLTCTLCVSLSSKTLAVAAPPLLLHIQTRIAALSIANDDLPGHLASLASLARGPPLS